MAEPQSPVFDFSALPRFRTIPTRAVDAAHGPHNGFPSHVGAPDPLASADSRAELIRVARQATQAGGGTWRPGQHFSSPAPSPGFFRSFTAGDLKYGDAEGAREDEAIAADLLQPRPILPKGWAVTAADPVEASAEGGAYERDGVLVPPALDAYVRPHYETGPPGMATAAIFPLRRSRARASNNPDAAGMDRPGVGRHTIALPPGLSPPPAPAQTAGKRLPSHTLTVQPPIPALVERVHASHKSPRPDVETLLGFQPASVASDGSTIFEAAHLLATPPPAPVSKTTTRAISPQRAQSQASLVERHSRAQRYAHVLSRYKTQPRGRAASVEPRPRGAPRAKAQPEPRASSVPRRASLSHGGSGVSKASGHALAPSAVPAQRPADSRPQQIVVGGHRKPQEPAPRMTSAPSLAARTDGAPNAALTALGVLPASPSFLGPVSVEELRQRLRAKQQELTATVGNLKATESDIDAVGRRKKQVEDLIKVLLDHLQAARGRPVEQSNHQTGRVRARTPPFPPPSYAAASHASPESAAFVMQHPSSHPHLNGDAYRAHAGTAQAASALVGTRDATRNYLPLPQPASGPVQQKPLHERVQDLVNLRMQMVESSLSEALRPVAVADIPVGTAARVDQRPRGGLEAAGGSPPDNGIPQRSTTPPPPVNPGTAVGPPSSVPVPQQPVSLHPEPIASSTAPVARTPDALPSTAAPEARPDTSSPLARNAEILKALDSVLHSTLPSQSTTPPPPLPSLGGHEAPLQQTAESAAPHATTETTAPADVPPAERVCVQCESQAAVRRCHECGDEYCESCFSIVHKSGNRKHHLWTPFSPQAAKEAPRRPAKISPPRNEPVLKAAKPAQEKSPAAPVSRPQAAGVESSQPLFSSFSGSLALFRKHNVTAGGAASVATAVTGGPHQALASASVEATASTTASTALTHELPPNAERFLASDTLHRLPTQEPSLSTLMHPRERAASERFVARMKRGGPSSSRSPTRRPASARSKSPSDARGRAPLGLSGGGGMASRWKLRV